MRKWTVGKEGCHTMNCKMMIMTYLYCSRESHLFRLKLETNHDTSHLPNFFQDSKVHCKVDMSGVSIWVMRKRKVGNEWWHTMKCMMMIVAFPHCSRDSQLFRLRCVTNLGKSHRPHFSQELDDLLQSGHVCGDEETEGGERMMMTHHERSHLLHSHDGFGGTQQACNLILCFKFQISGEG